MAETVSERGEQSASPYCLFQSQKHCVPLILIMGYDLNRFEGYVDEELVCPICSGVLEEPLQVRSTLLIESGSGISLSTMPKCIQNHVVSLTFAGTRM